MIERPMWNDHRMRAAWLLAQPQPIRVIAACLLTWDPTFPHAHNRPYHARAVHRLRVMHVMRSAMMERMPAGQLVDVLRAVRPWRLLPAVLGGAPPSGRALEDIITDSSRAMGLDTDPDMYHVWDDRCYAAVRNMCALPMLDKQLQLLWWLDTRTYSASGVELPLHESPDKHSPFDVINLLVSWGDNGRVVCDIMSEKGFDAGLAEARKHGLVPTALPNPEGDTDVVGAQLVATRARYPASGVVR